MRSIASLTMVAPVLCLYLFSFCWCWFILRPVSRWKEGVMSLACIWLGDETQNVVTHDFDGGCRRTVSAFCHWLIAVILSEAISLVTVPLASECGTSFYSRPSLRLFTVIGFPLVKRGRWFSAKCGKQRNRRVTFLWACRSKNKSIRKHALLRFLYLQWGVLVLLYYLGLFWTYVGKSRIYVPCSFGGVA